MKVLKMLFAVSIVLCFAASAAVAGDFDWMRDFNIKAQADPSGFGAQLENRFKIGDTQIGVVLSNVDSPPPLIWYSGAEHQCTLRYI